MTSKSLKKTFDDNDSINSNWKNLDKMAVETDDDERTNGNFVDSDDVKQENGLNLSSDDESVFNSCVDINEAVNVQIKTLDDVVSKIDDEISTDQVFKKPKDAPKKVKKDKTKFGLSTLVKRKSKSHVPDQKQNELTRSDSRSSINSSESESLVSRFKSGITPLLRRKSERKSKLGNLERAGSRLSLYSLSEDRTDSAQSFGSLSDITEKVREKRKSLLKRTISSLLSSTPNLQSLNNLDQPLHDGAFEKRASNTRLNSMWDNSLQSLAEDSILSHSCVDLNANIRKNEMNKSIIDGSDRKGLTRTKSLIMDSSVVHRPRSYSGGNISRRSCNENLDIRKQRDAASRVPSVHVFQGRPVSADFSLNFHHQLANADDVTWKNEDSSGQKLGRAKPNKTSKLPRPSSSFPLYSVRSRSLTHLDCFDPKSSKQKNNGETKGHLHRTEIEGLKDSRSEPDCTLKMLPAEHLIVPSTESSRSHLPTSPASNRRQMMSRSQVSSSEYFSISFELGDDPIAIGREEFLPATKGTTLADAISNVCFNRGIDIAACDIYLDGQKTSHSILTTETSWLGGKHIRITAKDASVHKKSLSNQSSHSRKSSGSYRSKTGRFFSASTEDSTAGQSSQNVPVLYDGKLGFPDSEQLKKKEKQRWSGFFSNNKDTKMESLVEYLNNYSRLGVLFPEEKGSGELHDSVKSLYNLESDWRNLMDSTRLTERQQQQQTALWELITTEADYIKMLKVVTNLFLACLQNLQASNILIEIDKDKLFSNITEIHSSNLCFWTLYIYPMLKYTRDSREPLNPELLLPGFLKFHEVFEPYTKYCSDQSKCQYYCREMHSQNELFTAYLVWCETQKDCNRLRLMDILVRPMQRLTKYGLILKVIHKNTELEAHRESLNVMIKYVDDFVNSVNSTLKFKQDSESLKRVISRIESYDLVESKDDDLEKIVRKYSELDLTRPMLGCNVDRRRHLLLEDDFKLKDNLSSKIEVHCILMTDLLLICKPSTKKGSNGIRVIRQPFIVDRLVFSELQREPSSIGFVYLNEFNMAVVAFTLGGDTKKLKNWMEYIKKAQGLYRQAKQASALIVRQQSVTEVEACEYSSLEFGNEDSHSLLGLIPRSPMANSSRASRVSSLIHSHSGSIEMNDQSSIGSLNNQSRAISMETDQRTASMSSDEGVPSLPGENILKSPMTSKQTLKQRLHATSQPKKITTPNTLSVQPYGNLGQSLPNLVLGSPNASTMTLVSPNTHTLSVPSTVKNSQHLLSPNHRGISYPPPSPTRGNLRRGFAIQHSKNPPLLKTRHISSMVGTSSSNLGPMSVEYDVPVIAGVSVAGESPRYYDRNQQVILRRLCRGSNRRYLTTSFVDDLKKSDNHDSSMKKRLSWNCGLYQSDSRTEDHSSN